MGLLSSVNQVMFLQVGQLSKVLTAGLTLEGTLSTVHSQMDLRMVCQRLVLLPLIQLCQTLKTLVAVKFKLFPYISNIVQVRIQPLN